VVAARSDLGEWIDYQGSVESYVGDSVLEREALGHNNRRKEQDQAAVANELVSICHEEQKDDQNPSCA
jgi:hypothetical protein